MDRFGFRKVRRSQIASNLESSQSYGSLFQKIICMPRHLLGTFALDVEMFIKCTHVEIKASGDLDFFSDNWWFMKFDMQKVFDFLQKECMI